MSVRFVLASSSPRRRELLKSIGLEFDVVPSHIPEERAAVRGALEIIDEDPIIGAPLFDPLRGYWSFHVDGLRILYRIVAEARFVVILSITRR